MRWLLPFLLTVSVPLFGCSDDAGSSGSGGGGGSGGDTSGGSGGEDPGPIELRVMNWNTQNFYNDKMDSPNALDEQVLSTSAFTSKVNSVANVIRDEDVDVAVFAEVENETVLEAINDALGGSYDEQYLVFSNDPRGLDIAVLSRRPIDNVVSHINDSFTKEGTTAPTYQFARNCAEIHMTLSNRPIVLLGVHFKAKAPPDDPDKRLAEAQRVREIADELLAEDPERGILILGDINDTPGTPPVDALLNGSETFFSVATEVPSNDQWTFQFGGTEELIDDQIVNSIMEDFLIQGSATIVHDAQVNAASDHAPVIATYDID